MVGKRGVSEDSKVRPCNTCAMGESCMPEPNVQW